MGPGLLGRTAAFVLAVVWSVIRLTGVPGFVPAVPDWLHANAGL